MRKKEECVGVWPCNVLLVLLVVLAGCAATTSGGQGSNGSANRTGPLQGSSGGGAANQPMTIPPPSTGGGQQRSSGSLPNGSAKPQPVAGTFEGCPAGGDGGDHSLNILKNRTDSGAWTAASVASILSLQWPRTIQQRPRQSWTQPDAAAVAQYEGTPLQIEGYLAGAKQQGPESSNCHAVDQVDNHIWVVDDPAKDRTQSVVVEVTPRTRALHPGWAFSRIAALVDHRTKVRISGWLLMDQEHPDQVGKTRGTIWELHPVVGFDVWQGSRWVALDTGDAIASTGGVSKPVPTEDPSLPPPIVDPKDQEANRATPIPTHRTGTAGEQPLHIGPMAIVDIFYRGTKKPNEPDEYVELENTGNSPVDLTGWSLHDMYGGNVFRWTNVSLGSQQRIRVYTNEQHPESGGFSFHSSQAIWNNSGDAAELVDANGVIVAVYGYGNKR